MLDATTDAADDTWNFYRCLMLLLMLLMIHETVRHFILLLMLLMIHGTVIDA